MPSAINAVKICPVCHRTDAFSPGRIKCDQEWHEAENLREQENKRPKNFKIGKLK